jgi:hypothetical protein
MSQLMASTHTDESSSISGGDPASAARDFRRHVRLHNDGHPVLLQKHRTEMTSQMSIIDAEQLRYDYRIGPDADRK